MKPYKVLTDHGAGVGKNVAVVFDPAARQPIGRSGALVGSIHADGETDMNTATKTRADDGRSSIDHLADRAPPALQDTAQSLALAADKAKTALMKAGTATKEAMPDRNTGALIGVGLLALGVVAGLLINKDSRRVIIEKTRLN